MQTPVARKLMAGWIMLSAACGSIAATADTFPSRSLRIVMNIAAGGNGDSVARQVAERLGTALGQPVVVENRPGADALVSVQNVLNAPADGYSLIMLTPSSVAQPLLQKEVGYGARRDFRPLTMIYRTAAALVTRADSPYATVDQFLTATRANPGTVSLATYGLSYRAGAMLLAHQGRMRFNDISYKGYSQAANDVIGGAVDAALVDAGSAMPLVQSGKLRVLAVASRDRLPAFPSVPTFRERGFPEYELYVWLGLAVRAQTPDATVQRLEKELTRIVATPDFKAFVGKFGAGTEVIASNGAQMANQLANEDARYRTALAGLERK
ncbi:Bug family tripartite tricarboxylate transporter substrate binding protein [Cupriavidus oxalaticus]|nr:tripartite tricarboxylate transporter substrate binding protein [Cupriavidus oxalaticus]